jgi:hypothetical protein
MKTIYIILIFLTYACSKDKNAETNLNKIIKLDSKEKEKMLSNSYLKKDGVFVAYALSEKRIITNDSLFNGILFLTNNHLIADYLNLKKPLQFKMYWCEDPLNPAYIEIKDFVGDTGIVSFKANVNDFNGKDTVLKKWGGLIKFPVDNGMDTSFLLQYEYLVVK